MRPLLGLVIYREESHVNQWECLLTEMLEYFLHDWNCLKR